MKPNLEAEADALETTHSPTCTLCHFVSEQDPEMAEAWDALMRGPRKHSTVWRLLKQYGFRGTEGPVSNHRNSGHRS